MKLVSPKVLELSVVGGWKFCTCALLYSMGYIRLV